MSKTIKGKSKFRGNFALSLLAASSLCFQPLAAEADYNWPNNQIRDNYYAYNPYGGSPYAFVPDSGNTFYARNNGTRVNISPIKVIVSNGNFNLTIIIKNANASRSYDMFNQINTAHPVYSSEYWRSRFNKQATYANVKYRDVYPGTDLTYYNAYNDNRNYLGYDFTVAPGADPKNIGLDFSQARQIIIDDQGNLVIFTRDGRVLLQKLKVFQNIGDQYRDVNADYRLYDNNQVGFDYGPYDENYPLYVDPMMTYPRDLSRTDYSQNVYYNNKDYGPPENPRTNPAGLYRNY